MSKKDWRKQVRAAQETKSANELELRFVLEAAPGQDLVALRKELERRLKLRFRLSPLFAAPLAGKARERLAAIHLLRIPGLDAEGVGISPFDIAAEIEEAPGVIKAEPDLETDFFPTPETAFPGCWVEGETPKDRAWALRNLRVPEAWQLSGKRGEGVFIAQIDTGITTHPEIVDALDIGRGADLIEGDADPTDPLEHGFMLNPGHGTATASVAVSRGDVARATPGQESGTTIGKVTGSAPGATLVPIRAIKSVVRLTQSRVAQGIEHARRRGCHVITMSLGGLPSLALSRALEAAIQDDLIVMAAAGNCVRQVVYPAAYDACLAVGGSNLADAIWRGSCRGPEVDVCAPAENVWRAKRQRLDDPPDEAGGGEGTSYAVALIAGVAALWLSHHGRDELRAKAAAKGLKVQDLFKFAVKQAARVPQAGWDHALFGRGIVNAKALLEEDLDAAPEAVVEPEAAPTVEPSGELLVARSLMPRGGAAPEAAPQAAAGMNAAALAPHALEVTWLALKARTALMRSGLEGLEAAIAAPQPSRRLSGSVSKATLKALRSRLEAMKSGAA